MNTDIKFLTNFFYKMEMSIAQEACYWFGFN